jgi:hypothetical protein
MPPDLNSAVRRAVAAGDFNRARYLWEQYTLQCRQALRQGEDANGTLEGARQLMVWCRQMALAARAQAQSQLNRLAGQTRVAVAYGQPATPPPGSIRIVRY